MRPLLCLVVRPLEPKGNPWGCCHRVQKLTHDVQFSRSFMLKAATVYTHIQRVSCCLAAVGTYCTAMPPKRKSDDDKDAVAKKARSSGGASNSGTTPGKTAKGKGKKKTADATESKRSSAASSSPDSGGGASTTQTAPRPKRNKQGQLIFPDFPKFRPNLSPKQVLRMGSFGGTYFRPIKSSVTGKTYRDQWKEFPEDWFEGMNIKRQVANPTYLNSVNMYGVHCGGDLHMWESSGWIKECDPYGWFQWYCRFYLGRRCYDDERQISRGLKVFGPTGRWRTQLCNRILVKGTDADDKTVSPKIRQLMQHWGYRITDADLDAHAKKSKKG